MNLSSTLEQEKVIREFHIFHFTVPGPPGGYGAQNPFLHIIKAGTIPKVRAKDTDFPSKIYEACSSIPVPSQSSQYFFLISILMIQGMIQLKWPLKSNE